MSCTFLGLYNEDLRDNLAPGPGSARGHVRLCQSPHFGVYPEGVTETPVGSAREAVGLLEAGRRASMIWMSHMSQRSAWHTDVFTVLVRRLVCPGATCRHPGCSRAAAGLSSGDPSGSCRSRGPREGGCVSGSDGGESGTGDTGCGLGLGAGVGTPGGCEEPLPRLSRFYFVVPACVSYLAPSLPREARNISRSLLVMEKVVAMCNTPGQGPR